MKGKDTIPSSSPLIVTNRREETDINKGEDRLWCWKGAMAGVKKEDLSSAEAGSAEEVAALMKAIVFCGDGTWTEGLLGWPELNNDRYDSMMRSTWGSVRGRIETRFAHVSRELTTNAALWVSTPSELRRTDATRFSKT